MTDRLAIILGVLVGGLIALDVIVDDSANLIFLGRKFLDLLEYIAFWR